MEHIVNENVIQEILERSVDPPKEAILSILKKAKEARGLTPEEVGFLVNLTDPELKEELFHTASLLKERIYGERLVFFAPLYISDFCVNDCEYCNFHIRNTTLKRRRLTLQEVEEQTEFLINMGHKRVLLECGEDPENAPIDYVLEVIERIYSLRTPKGNIRRINVNIAATTLENYRKLKQAKIGTYQLFQETYHRKTYQRLHRGPKADFQRQITAHERALQAGIDDFGMGVLFGLYDWRFEILALILHAKYLEEKFGVGPHTISVPRFRKGPTVAYRPEYEVSDEDFLKLIAILRIAVPYTGMIISTREDPQIRRHAFRIGISQASAGSVTSTGGYGRKTIEEAQFELYDHRGLAEVIGGILEERLLPSFCTACYRLGRTGQDFMSLAKPGEIHHFCRSNGLLTFAEYLEDFAGDGIYKKGYEIINFYLEKIEDKGLREQTQARLEKIKQGQRDLYF